MAKQNKKVVAIADKKQEDLEAMARLHAEAYAKDDPSAEAKESVDSRFDEKPEEWKAHGDLCGQALDLGFKDFWLGYVTKEAVRRSADALKIGLGFEDASIAERMMIEHVVLCHVRLGMMEHLYSRQTRMTNYRMDHVEHFEKRLTLAQNRFNRAMTTLVKVRALLARAEAARATAQKASIAKSLSVLKQMTG